MRRRARRADEAQWRRGEEELVPAVLGAEFAVAALATTLAFWIVLGVVSGFINERFVKAQ